MEVVEKLMVFLDENVPVTSGCSQANLVLNILTMSLCTVIRIIAVPGTHKEFIEAIIFHLNENLDVK